MYVLFERFRFVSVMKIDPLGFDTFFVLEYAIRIGCVEFDEMSPADVEFVRVMDPEVEMFPVDVEFVRVSSVDAVVLPVAVIPVIVDDVTEMEPGEENVPVDNL